MGAHEDASDRPERSNLQRDLNDIGVRNELAQGSRKVLASVEARGREQLDRLLYSYSYGWAQPPIFLAALLSRSIRL
jgi:hypothetical protein